ncbi:MAG: DUF5667 domain-containing protein [Patescibacteria group bacterium]|nr:DUF5667 domain-containing protein [Patescibacteria group bacterium]
MDNYKQLKISIWMVVVSLLFGLMLGVTVAQGQGNTGMQEVKEGYELETIDYYLPYPGILPDSPFYWLKMVRDRVGLWLSFNPLQKAEKLLLYADKRLGAGYSLVDGNKIKLGVTTLTKAEKYLEKANMIANQINGEEELKIKLDKAIRKHKEVLEMIENKIGEEYGLVMGQMIEKINY